MLYSIKEAIAVWRVICELTRSYELGIQAKMSCVKNREVLGERLICVSPYDSDDLEDLQRVVDKLRRSIDPKHRLIYQEDSMTRAGFYQDAGRRISKWYVRAFREDHESRKRVEASSRRRVCQVRVIEMCRGPSDTWEKNHEVS